MGEVANCFCKGEINQNVYVKIEVKNVGSNISPFEHYTNFPHVKMLEHTLVMSEKPTVVYLASTLFTCRTSI